MWEFKNIGSSKSIQSKALRSTRRRNCESKWMFIPAIKRQKIVKFTSIAFHEWIGGASPLSQKARLHGEQFDATNNILMLFLINAQELSVGILTVKLNLGQQ